MKNNEEKLILDVENLSVRYETEDGIVRALNGVDFKLGFRKTLGLVGETGAGKTTSALAMLRLIPDPPGVVECDKLEIDGQNILALKPSDMEKIRGEKVSMIFQDPMTSLNPVLPVGKQIAEALKYHNKDNKTKEQIEERVEETLELVGIPRSRKNEYPHQFSGGMKQRVVIAIALACEPDLLIADEPTTALDVTIQAQVLAMMAELREKLGTAMIMITHDLGIVAQVCDYVAVMYAGELVEQGPIETIFEGENHHPYTRGLFGSIPKLDSEEERLTSIEGMLPDPTDLPQGCYFSPRCPHCMDICRKEHPKDFIEGEHRICCHLFDEKIKEG